jgi:hypothetical protein
LYINDFNRQKDQDFSNILRAQILINKRDMIKRPPKIYRMANTQSIKKMKISLNLHPAK